MMKNKIKNNELFVSCEEIVSLYNTGRTIKYLSKTVESIENISLRDAQYKVESTILEYYKNQRKLEQREQTRLF